MSVSKDVIKFINDFENGVTQGLSTDFVVHSQFAIPGVEGRDFEADIYISSPFRAAVEIKYIRSHAGMLLQNIAMLNSYARQMSLIFILIYKGTKPRIPDQLKQGTFIFVEDEDAFSDPQEAGRECAQIIRNNWAHGRFGSPLLERLQHKIDVIDEVIGLEKIDAIDEVLRLDDAVLDPSESTFDIALAALKQFIEREGHPNVPINHKEGSLSSSQFALGMWVQNMRGEHKSGILNQDRIQSLEELQGWVWNRSDALFQDGLTALQRFLEVQGHSKVPRNHLEGDFALGKWAQNIRANYRAGKLEADRLQHIEELPGWSWDVPDREFQAGMTALKQFIEREGHSKVPWNHLEGDFSLGTWLRDHERATRALSPELRALQLLSHLKFVDSKNSSISNLEKLNCEICGNELDMGTATVDYIIPLANGGSSDVSNLRALCPNCQNSKRVISDRDPARIFSLLDSFDHLIAPEYQDAIRGEMAELNREYLNNHYTACAVRIGRTLEWLIYRLAEAWDVKIDKQTLKLIGSAKDSMDELQTAVIEFTTVDEGEKRQSIFRDIRRHRNDVTKKTQSLIDTLTEYMLDQSKLVDSLSPQELTERPTPSAVLRNIRKKFRKYPLVVKEINEILDGTKTQPSLIRAILDRRNDGAHANWEGQSREVDKEQVDEMLLHLRVVINKLVNLGETVINDDEDMA